MKILRIISEHKRIRPSFKRTEEGGWKREFIPVARGYKRVEAVCDLSGHIATRHLDVPI